MPQNATITLTIPMDAETLTKTADYLLALARGRMPVVISAEEKQAIREEASAPPAPPAKEASAPPAEAADSDGVQLDRAGLPWDSRIHSSSDKPMKKDGYWKGKRGIDPETVARVEAELLATMKAGKPAQRDAPPPPPKSGETVTKGDAPGSDFASVMRRITAGMSAGKITQTQVDEAVKTAGVPTLPMLVNRPDLLAAMSTILGGYGV